jgi:hypothetical protein
MFIDEVSAEERIKGSGFVQVVPTMITDTEEA